MRSSRQFSFLNGPNKLVFIRMHGSTFAGLLGPPYPYCSLVAFCTFLCFFVLYCTQKNTHKKKLTKKHKNKNNNNNKNNNLPRVQTSKRMKITYFAIAYINI